MKERKLIMIAHRSGKTSICIPFPLLLRCSCMERRIFLPTSHTAPPFAPEPPPAAVVNRICTARERIENCAHHVFLEKGESATVVNAMGDMVIFCNLTSGRISACLKRMVEITEG